MIRSQKGQGIIEGAIGLTLIIAGGVMATLLVLNSGEGIFFKEKLVIVANLAAQYAATLPNGSNYSSMTQNYVQNTVLPAVGIPPNDLTVTVQVPAPGFPASSGYVQAQVSNKFSLFGSGSLIPNTISLADSEVSNGGNGGGGQPVAYICLGTGGAPDGNGGYAGAMYIPVSSWWNGGGNHGTLLPNLPVFNWTDVMYTSSNP